MFSNSIKRIFMVSAVAGSLFATDALAQGRGNSDRQDRGKASQDRRGADRPELIRRGDVYETQQRRNSSAQNAPAFCRSGAGHPVHGRRWCEDKGWGVYNSGRYESGRYDPRIDDRNRRNASSRTGSSYEAAHREFHLQHDRQCSARAAERPLDLQHQVRVRNECRQRHDEWHRRAGRSH
jgi:hypothetical protein